MPQNIGPEEAVFPLNDYGKIYPCWKNKYRYTFFTYGDRDEFNAKASSYRYLWTKLYHIALAYRVTNADFKSFNASIVAEDVNGSLWVNRQQLCMENSSPLLRSILENYEK